nr:hypothetical protein [Tanacetum cinerariifolium]
MDLQDKGVIDSRRSRVPRKNNMYSVDLKNIVPKGGTNDKTSGILKSFITRIENLVDHKVKVIRCDNGNEFKNKEMHQFGEMNEAVNIACHVQNRVLVVKHHNKTPYEHFHGRTPTLSFIRPFGYPVTILNTLDHLGKFNGSGPDWLFDIDALTRTINYEPIVTGTQFNGFVGFEDPNFPDRVYKVEKALYGLHQAPRAWYETLSTYLVDNGFQSGKISKTLFIKRHKGDILLMSSIGELTFLLGLEVKQKNDGMFISQEKYVAEILKKFGFTEVNNASTRMETQKPLLKDDDGEKVDVHMYRRDLQLADEEGVDCLSNSTIFENLDLIGYLSLVVLLNVGEVVHKERGDILVKASTTASSLEAKQDSGNIDKNQSKATPNKASSPGTTSGGSPRCQEAIGDEIAQTRFENVSKLSNDSLLVRGNTLRSDEDRIKLNELMELCTNLQSRVLDLEKTKTTQALKITSLKKRVKKLKKKQRSRTHKLKILYKEINDIDVDEDITLVNDQDDAEMFGVNDLHGEEMFVEKEVTDKEVSAAGEVNAAIIATTVSAAATITTEEIT